MLTPTSLVPEVSVELKGTLADPDLHIVGQHEATSDSPYPSSPNRATALVDASNVPIGVAELYRGTRRVASPSPPRLRPEEPIRSWEVEFDDLAIERLPAPPDF